MGSNKNPASIIFQVKSDISGEIKDVLDFDWRWGEGWLIIQSF